MNKELLTNLVALTLVGASYLIPANFSNHIFYTGAFALSGSLTNQIAIYMLFNKVPFLYGSGIIELEFEKLKLSIKSLVMDEFFSKDKLSSKEFDISSVIEEFDFSPSFDALVEAINESKFASLIGLIGGTSALESLREPFVKKLKSSLVKLSKSGIDFSDAFSEQIEKLVQKRLDELTPSMVKELLQNLMKEHLSWLVVWGGVFGGFLGLLSSFVK